MLVRKKKKKESETYPQYGDKMPGRLRGPAMLGASDSDVTELMRMLGAMPQGRALDMNAPPPPENPAVRFFNVTADQPNARNIIRAQVYDEEGGGYGGNVTLDALLDRADKDPALASELAKMFGPGASNKRFQKRFGSDVDFARLFVDVLGERGELGDYNVISPKTTYRAITKGDPKGGMPGSTKGKGRDCIKDSKGLCVQGETFQSGLSLVPHAYDAKGPYQ